MLKLISQYITRTCLNDKRGCDPDKPPDLLIDAQIHNTLEYWSPDRLASLLQTIQG